MNNGIFTIGDKVAVIDDTITGRITEIDGTAITITDNEGFDYIYEERELVPLFSLKGSFVTPNKDQHITTKKTQVEKPNSKEVLEVDLHIHELTRSDGHLSNHQKLSRQLDHAEQRLKYAIKNNVQKVVFIHGIGQGVLKKELYTLLKKYKVSINDANYQKYGRGASEVYIFRNQN